MKEKFTLLINSLILLFCSILFISCKKEEKQEKKKSIEWSAVINAPTNYASAHTMVTFCYNKKVVGGISTPFAGGGWSDIDVVESIVDGRHLPDSIFVEWTDNNEAYMYKGGINLPVKKMQKLFESGYYKEGKKNDFRTIRIGVAPGGTVCVWVDHVEILRSKVNNIGKAEISEEEAYYYKINNKDRIEYIKHHPIDYTIWEKPDKRYDLDFGFCSEDGSSNLYHSYFVSKEGIPYAVFKDYFENTIFNQPFGKPSSKDLNFGYIQINDSLDHKLHLPVHCKIEWKNSKTLKKYSTEVVLPRDFKEKFVKSYTNPKSGKISNYNRIVFGVEKDGEHCIIWLDGSGKQQKIMRFKAQEGKMTDIGLDSGGYATEVIYY